MAAHRKGSREQEVLIGEFVPIGSEGGWGGRPDRLVPGRQISSGGSIQLLHGLIPFFEGHGIRVEKQGRLDAQAGTPDCRAAGVEDGL